jgi:hypothetical protein
MLAVNRFKHTEFRHKVTEVIFEVLGRLPETQRKIFVWNHYCGYPPPQIAEILSCASTEVETALEVINSTLYQRTLALLAEDPRPNVEERLSDDLPSQETRRCCLLGSPIKQSWVSHAHA